MSLQSQFIRFVTLAFLGLGFVACKPMKAVDAPVKGSLTTSDTNFNPLSDGSVIEVPVRSSFGNDCNPENGIKLVKNQDGTKTILLHSFCIKNASAKLDQVTHKMSFKGTADFESYRNLGAFDFNVEGSISKGRGLLTAQKAKNADPNAPEFVAAFFCNTPGDAHLTDSCHSFFIDLYIKIRGYDNELFDEQVQDCGKSDQCLSLSKKSSAAPETDDQSSAKNVDSGKDANSQKSSADQDSVNRPKDLPLDPNPSQSNSLGHPQSQATTNPDPVKPVGDLASKQNEGTQNTPKQSSAGDSSPGQLPATDLDSARLVNQQSNQQSDQKSKDQTASGDIDLDDEAENEGADLPDQPAQYTANNVTSKVNPIFGLFDSQSRGDDFFEAQMADSPAPVAASADTPKKEDAPPASPKTAAPVTPPVVTAKKSPPSAPAVPANSKPDKPVATTAPVKNSTPVKAPAEPSDKPEVKTRVPEPVDPQLAQNDFPYNIQVPTTGPQQVRGGGRNGALENATELLDVPAGETQTYVIDTRTKSLNNRSQRRTYGAFYTVEFLKRLADFTFGLLNHPIRINDISRQNGGHLEPHQWHRAGLDVDVEYSLIPQDAAHQMTPEQKWIIFQRVAASPLVNGIFVDIKDKRAACQIANLRKDYDPVSKLAMQKLKIEDGHKTHFHINFGCTYNERCDRRIEDELRAQYAKNEAACLAFKLPDHTSTKAVAKK